MIIMPKIQCHRKHTELGGMSVPYTLQLQKLNRNLRQTSIKVQNSVGQELDYSQTLILEYIDTIIYQN